MSVEVRKIINLPCPLCGNSKQKPIYLGQDDRTYIHCLECDLIFVHPDNRPKRDLEKSRYLEHNNGIEFPGYVKFLNSAIEPTIPFLAPNSHGLDFGCGHTPTLSILLERQSHTCENYDSFFFPELPENSFDFIFSTETFEHFFNPRKEIELILSLLKDEGILTVMTYFWHHPSDLQQHFYFRDKTHFVFYHPKTIEWIGRNFDLKIEYMDDNRVVIFRKTKA